MGKLGCPIKKRIGECLCQPKIMNFPLLCDINTTKNLSPPVPPLITDYILEKKVSLIAFTEILPKILPAVCTFSYTIKTYFKRLVGNKSFNTKQCLAELSLRIIPHYYPKYLQETMEKVGNHTQEPKIYSFPPPEISPLINLHL